MSDYHDHPMNKLLERYLDGLLNGDALSEFEKRLESDVSLRDAVAQHQSFEETLRREISPPDRTVAEIDSFLDVSSASVPSQLLGIPRPSSTDSRRRWVIGALSAIAATLAWALVVMRPGPNKRVKPFFEQRSLATLYRESVAQGFRPYYFCEDQERFAQTFRKRQQTRLVLAETPADRRMVGLSYLGGLSRDTTAMLAYVEEQPVIVFVDRKDVDNQPLVSLDGKALSNLHVHRREFKDLVMYEVSPFDTVKMVPYLQVELE